MAKMIFVNLPVKELTRSVEFFGKLGYTFNPQFTDENAACMVISEEIIVMLLTENYFKTFTPKPVADAHKSTEVIIAISAENRAEVDRLVDTALENGATKTNAPEDLGWMYQRSFQDLDGHLWEFAYMDMSALDET